MRTYRKALEDAIVSVVSNKPEKGQGEAPVGWSKLNPNQKIDVQRIIDSLVKLNDLTHSTDSPPRSDTND